MAINIATGMPTSHGHIFGRGTMAPHFGQDFAVVLISLPHSLHAMIAIYVPELRKKKAPNAQAQRRACRSEAEARPSAGAPCWTCFVLAERGHSICIYAHVSDPSPAKSYVLVLADYSQCFKERWIHAVPGDNVADGLP